MREISGKNVLVTGGAGFIGSHLVDNLLKENVKSVTAIDNLFLGNKSNLTEAFRNNKFKLYIDDAENLQILEYIMETHNIDIVFNCATKALNYSFLNPINSFKTNVDVILNLLEMQRKEKFKTLCHFSTSEVYGTAIYEPMDENHPKNPLTAYAGGKAAADLALESYVRMFNLDSFIVRPFNNYGPRQNHLGYMAGVIPITIWRIMKGYSPEIHGSGKQSRDFIYVEDTVKSVLKVFNFLSPGQSINVSTDNQIQIGELINLISEKMGYKGKILTKERRGSDVDAHLACNKKIKSLIDYSLVSFDEGLNMTIDWYKKQSLKDF